MATRVEAEDTLPERLRGYDYYLQYQEDCNFPIYCRRRANNRQAQEEVALINGYVFTVNLYECVISTHE